MSSLDTRTLLEHDHSWNTSHLGTTCDKTVGVDEQTIYNMNILEPLAIWTHGQKEHGQYYHRGASTLTVRYGRPRF